MILASATDRAAFAEPFDACVIGSGPAGITLARALAARGARVALMEAGGLGISKVALTVRGEVEGLDEAGFVKAAEAAKQRVLSITAEAEIGKIYVGKVERIVDFGAFVNILPGKDGLVHISQISDQRIEKVSDVLKEGQEVKVLVLDVDNRGRIKLSIKDVAAAEASGA